MPTASTLPDTFGARLRAARGRARLSIAEAARLAGLSKSRWHQLESQTDPDPETVGRLALALGLDPCDLWPSVPLLCRWERDSVVAGRDRIGTLADLRTLAGERDVVIRGG